MTERQLHLFRGKRQKGELPRPPLEFALHCQLADVLRLSIAPPWKFSHLPFGELRHPATAARLKRMGVNGGLPDFMFVGRGFAFLELKREGSGRLSDDQVAWSRALVDAGAAFMCCNNLRDALDWLRDRGIVRVRVSA
jgi:hypothetical protein